MGQSHLSSLSIDETRRMKLLMSALGPVPPCQERTKAMQEALGRHLGKQVSSPHVLITLSDTSAHGSHARTFSEPPETGCTQGGFR